MVLLISAMTCPKRLVDASDPAVFDADPPENPRSLFFTLVYV